MKKLLKDCLYIFFVVVVMFFVTDQPSFSKTIKFAQVSDIHYTTAREDNSYKLLSQTKPLLVDAIDQINKEKNVDFIAITGDGIDLPKKDELYGLIKILNTLNRPWYFALGNHDTTTSGELKKDKFLTILQKENKDFKFDSLYYTFKPEKGFRVIVLDGAKNKGVSSNGIIPKSQLTWLDTVLSKSKKDVVLVFIHFPLYPPFDSPHHEILNADELKAVFDKYKMPIAMFTGHYHMTKILKRGNFLHVSTPSLAGYPNAFRMIEIENKRDKVIFNFKFMETNLKELQKKTKIMTFGGASYYGREFDRNTTVVIKKK